jgi:hypothetical protein
MLAPGEALDRLAGRLWHTAAATIPWPKQPGGGHDGGVPSTRGGNRADALHRVQRRRALAPLLHRRARRRDRDGEPTIVALANGWIIINIGGGPTDDKPTVTLEPPPDPDRVSSFLNIRVADIRAIYDDWSARGAEFLTPPQDRGREIRCYLRDPDGHLIEVGQATGVPQPSTG